MTFSPIQALDFLHDPATDAAGGTTQARRVPHFFCIHPGGSLDGILQRPYSLFIEVGERQRLDRMVEQLFDRLPDLALSLTTRTAYRQNIARSIALHLNERFGLQGHKSLHIQTCLQEALVNAMVHGNLGIGSDFTSIDEMEDYYRLIERRLAENALCQRRVTVAAWDEGDSLKISVNDQGDGFAMSAEAPRGRLPHSRGIHFIRSLADRVWIGDDRRTLFMTFTY